MCCAELRACFVVCKKGRTKTKSKESSKIPPGWAGRMAGLWCSSPTLELTICFSSASMPLTWCSFENVRIQLWGSDLTSRLGRGSQWLLQTVGWIMSTGWRYLSSFSGRFTEKMSLLILGRWRDEGKRRLQKVPVDVCSLWNMKRQRAPPCFSVVSPISDTLALRTKCAWGEEIKIAKCFPFLWELTERWQNACGND